MSDTKLSIVNSMEERIHPYAASEVDFASLYQYCLVLNAKNGDIDDDGKSYVNYLQNSGLLCFLFMSSDKREVFVLLRVPMDKLKSFCDHLDYTMLLDPEKLEEAAARGIPERKIAPIKIAHNPIESKLKPYDYIYAPFKIDIPLELYWRPPEKQHPFREIIQYKVALALIETRSSGSGEPLHVERYIRQGKIKAFFPLHKPLKREDLKAKWLRFNPYPWTEPLEEIKFYFGEKIGMYFSFLSHYATWLAFPALIGLAFQLVVIVTDNFSSPVLPFFSAFICLWSITMLEYWKRRERYLALAWGMIGFESTDIDRPEFKGERVQSHITGHYVRYFPSHKRSVRVKQSFLVIAMLMFTVLAAITVVYVLKYFQYINQTVASVISAVQIQALNYVYSSLAEILTVWENHRTETEHTDALTSKLFLFQFVNSYATFFYLAFIAPYIGECGRTSSCMKNLAQNLGIIFAINLTIGNITEAVIPFVTFRNNLRKKGIDMRAYKALSRPERECLMAPYDNTKESIDNYAQVAIQFGYMALFVTSLPISATFCFIWLLIEAKLDGYALLYKFQRSQPRGAEDIGIWQTFMMLTSVAGVLTNAGLVAFTMDTLDGFTSLNRLWIFIGFILFCFGVQLSSTILIPDEPAEVDLQLERTDFLVDKVILKVEDDIVHLSNLPDTAVSYTINPSYPTTYQDALWEAHDEF